VALRAHLRQAARLLLDLMDLVMAAKAPPGKANAASKTARDSGSRRPRKRLISAAPEVPARGSRSTAHEAGEDRVNAPAFAEGESQNSRCRGRLSYALEPSLEGTRAARWREVH
jgi:hypothetical protein